MRKQDLQKKYSIDHAGHSFLFGINETKPDLILFSDIDGCLTNGQITIIEGRKIGNTYNVKDGQGVQLLKENNIKVVFITHKAEYTNRNHRQRARLLSVPIYEVADKAQAVEEIIAYSCMHFRCKDIPFAALGDDIFDLGMIKLAQIKGCPHDAHKDIRDYVALKNGVVVPKSHPPGISCFRFFAEAVLEMVIGLKLTGAIK